MNKLRGGYNEKILILNCDDGGHWWGYSDDTEELKINPFTTFGEFVKSIIEKPLENPSERKLQGNRWRNDYTGPNKWGYDWMKVAYKNNYLTLDDIYVVKYTDDDYTEYGGDEGSFKDKRMWNYFNYYDNIQLETTI